LAKFRPGTRTSPTANAIHDDEEFLASVVMDMDDIIKRIKSIF